MVTDTPTDAESFDPTICDRCGVTDLDKSEVTLLSYRFIPGELSLDYTFGTTRLLCEDCVNDIYGVIEEYA